MGTVQCLGPQTLSVPCPQSLPLCLDLSLCPRTYLRSSSHLPHQVVGDNVSQQPQQLVAGFGVTVEPALGLGHRSGAAPFNHVGHQRPLQEGEERSEEVTKMENV